MTKPTLPSPSRPTSLPPAALPRVSGGSMMEILTQMAKARDETSKAIAANTRG